MHVCKRRKKKFRPGTESQKLENKTEFAFLKVKRQEGRFKNAERDFHARADSDFQDLEGRFKTWRGDSRMLKEIFMSGT